jgi:Spy/CpxP family protein refolding chaperone
MFGFLIGSACVAGLAMMAARGRGYGCHGGFDRHGFDRHGFGRHGFGHHGFGHHGRGGFGPRTMGFGRRMLYRILDGLDTSPGQDKVILGAVDDLREAARNARRDLPDVRGRIAEAMRAESFDEQAFTAIFDEPISRLNQLRDEATKTAGVIHEALTPKQRERLSDLIGSSTRWGYGFGY